MNNLTEEQKYYNNEITYHTFVNPNYPTFSQFTHTIFEGLNFYRDCPEKYIEEVCEAAKAYEEYEEQEVKKLAYKILNKK